MKIQLNPHAALPVLGFGTYLIPDTEVAPIVEKAVGVGYRHIDTAAAYRNERGVGTGIAAAMKDQGLARDDIFVTTKLWPGNSAWGEVPKTGAATKDALGESLDLLGLDHVDLYLIHAAFDRDQMLPQWEALVELKAKGSARAIGVSNFDASHFEVIADAGLPAPEANQIELHPWSQLPALTGYMQQKGIAAIAYSSLAPLSTWRTGQGSAKSAAIRGADGSPFVAMAAKYGVSEAQLLLRWAVQKGYAILPKSTGEHRMRENSDVFSFCIDASDMEAMAAMDRGKGFAWESGDPLSAMQP